MNITILTSSLPERADMLAEAIKSVREQTVPVPHLVYVDHLRQSPSHAYNLLARGADTEWITFLDDDDTLMPHHVETLLASIEEDPEVDVVYTRPRCVGQHIAWYFEPFSADTLKTRSIVPITAAVRREVFWAAGGHYPEWGADWRLWQRISENGGRFRALETVTWRYKRHALGQRSWGELGEIYNQGGEPTRLLQETR